MFVAAGHLGSAGGSPLSSCRPRWSRPHLHPVVLWPLETPHRKELRSQLWQEPACEDTSPRGRGEILSWGLGIQGLALGRKSFPQVHGDKTQHTTHPSERTVQWLFVHPQCCGTRTTTVTHPPPAPPLAPGHPVSVPGGSGHPVSGPWPSCVWPRGVWPSRVCSQGAGEAVLESGCAHSARFPGSSMFLYVPLLPSFLRPNSVLLCEWMVTWAAPGHAAVGEHKHGCNVVFH